MSAKVNEPRKDRLNLGRMSDLSDMMNVNKAKKSASEYARIDIQHIEEDPNNPRTRYDAEKMRELAATIKNRGVITPISVRENPEKPGYYIINHGHRRYRASKMARRQTIPAVVDNSFQNIDQLIENIQRDNLPMMDIANFIGREISQGAKQKDIAERLGKSPGYISHYTKLLNLPESVGKAIAKGSIADVLVAYELINLEKDHPDEVRDFVQKEPEITRPGVAALRESLGGRSAGIAETAAQVKTKGRETQPAPAAASGESKGNNEDDEAEEKHAGTARFQADSGGVGETVAGDEASEAPKDQPEKMRKAVLTVMKGKQRAFLMLNLKPKSPKHIWIRYESELRGTAEVPLSSLSLVEVNEG